MPVAKPVSATPSVDVAIQKSADAFQAVIDDNAAVTADLQAQLDTLNAQITELVGQRNDVTQQLAAVTPEEVKKAKQAQQLLELLNTPNGMARLFRGGAL